MIVSLTTAPAPAPAGLTADWDKPWPQTCICPSVSWDGQTLTVNRLDTACPDHGRITPPAEALALLLAYLLPEHYTQHPAGPAFQRLRSVLQNATYGTARAFPVDLAALYLFLADEFLPAAEGAALRQLGELLPPVLRTVEYARSLGWVTYI